MKKAEPLNAKAARRKPEVLFFALFAFFAVLSLAVSHAE